MSKITVDLDQYEKATLDVVSKDCGITPNGLIRDLLRDAAVQWVAGKRYGRERVTESVQQPERGGEVQHD